LDYNPDEKQDADAENQLDANQWQRNTHEDLVLQLPLAVLGLGLKFFERPWPYATREQTEDRVVQTHYFN
jgi:hypothetical protein